MLPRKAASAEDATLACTRDTEKHERSESVWGPNNEISGGMLYATVDVRNFGSFEFP